MQKLKLVGVLVVLLMGFQAQAQDAVGAQTSAFRGLLGFTGGALNVGAEYEVRKSTLRSIGGYFFFQTEKESNGVVRVPQVMLLGGYMPLHLISKNIIDLYVAPGFGLGTVKVGGSSESIIGPSLKVGAEYRTSETNSFGIQFGQYYSWFNEKVVDPALIASAAMTILF